MSTFEEKMERMPSWQRDYVLNLPVHLARAKDTSRLDTVLTDPGFIRAKISRRSTASIVEDYDLCLGLLSGCQEESAGLVTDKIRMLRDALQMSAHILDNDPSQLASQLAGRLSMEESVGLKDTVERAANAAPSVTLMPVSRSLASPGCPLQKTLIGHSDKVMRVLIGGKDNIVVSASEDGCLKGWHVMSGQEIWSLHGMNAPMEIGPHGECVVLAKEDKSLVVLDINTGRLVRRVQHEFSGVNGITICPDSSRAFLALKDQMVRSISLEDGHCVLTLEGHADEVLATAIGADGKTAVSVSADGVLKVWDLCEGRELRTIEALAGWRHRPALSRKGSYVVSGSWTNSVTVWDIETGRDARTLKGHRGFVTSVILIDECIALSASWDKTMRVWDLNKGCEIAVLHGHSDWINDIAVTTDRHHAISASSDGTLKVWNLDKIA